MDCHDALLMTVDANGGSLQSRTAIQKLAYFYTQKIDSFTPKYVPYFYGPFSSEVASALVDLAAFSFVHEIAYSGFHRGYTYELTPNGKRLATKASKNLPDERQEIENTLNTCKQQCNLRPAPLSYAAKCHYILLNDGKAEYTVEDIKQAGAGLCWNISEDDIGTGIALLDKLDLAR